MTPKQGFKDALHDALAIQYGRFDSHHRETNAITNILFDQGFVILARSDLDALKRRAYRPFEGLNAKESA